MSQQPIVPSVEAHPSTLRPPPSIDLLQALLEGAPDAVYFKDRESRFTHISRGLARLLGLADPQEAYGKTDRDFFAAEHADQAMADERRIMETGEPIVDFVENEAAQRAAVTQFAADVMPQALGLLDNAQNKTERIRRRAARTSADALGQLAGQLATLLANGNAAHQLAVELCALTATAAAEQKALLEDIDDLRLNLRELTSLLEAPK